MLYEERYLALCGGKEYVRARYNTVFVKVLLKVEVNWIGR